ncbi:MAG: fasciclin domain-containing protein [Candidatus Moranbacteria bacterium]|nr:fasciclin domain-containing protein [Candidatus Moranbacteria bacterium]
MKMNTIKIAGNKLRFGFVALLAASIFAISCEKETVTPLNPAMPGSQSEIDGQKVRLDDSFSTIGEASIAQIAIDAGFDQLVGALVYVDENLNSGLVDLFLNGKDQLTVFAPTNDAFDALYSALEIDDITDLPAELVLDVLKYHVVEGRRGANSVVPPVRTRNINTLLGVSFQVSAEGQITDIAGNTINILAADIPASNGIIHVIDGVLLPLD